MRKSPGIESASKGLRIADSGGWREGHGVVRRRRRRSKRMLQAALLIYDKWPEKEEEEEEGGVEGVAVVIVAFSRPDNRNEWIRGGITRLQGFGFSPKLHKTQAAGSTRLLGPYPFVQDPLALPSLWPIKKVCRESNDCKMVQKVRPGGSDAMKVGRSVEIGGWRAKMIHDSSSSSSLSSSWPRHSNGLIAANNSAPKQSQSEQPTVSHCHPPIHPPIHPSIHPSIYPPFNTRLQIVEFGNLLLQRGSGGGGEKWGCK